MDERYEKLADLVFMIGDDAESLDSGEVREGNAFMIWSDLEYLKRKVDKAYALARELTNVEGSGK
jgi:hypothetical protein